MSSVLEDKVRVLGFLLPWKLFRLRRTSRCSGPLDTSRKVAGSILFGVIQMFHWPNPSGRAVALGSTVALTEMSTRNISRGLKAVGA